MNATRSISSAGHSRHMRRAVAALLTSIHVAVPLVGVNSVALAQTDYPSRAIKIVVPLPAGPVADMVPRLIGEKLSAKWSQPVIIENRPGGALNIGTDAVARAEPDGYTLLATPPGPLVVSQHYYRSLPFDPTAFVPISTMVKVPAVLVVNPKLPVGNLLQLIAYAKDNPGKLSYGSPGAGNTPQLAMEKLMSAAGIRLAHIPYQGLAPASRDLVAGHIDVMIDNLGNAAEHIRAGNLKLIAVTTDARISQFPDVATVAETLPGVTHTDWFAVVAPPKTSTEVAAKISSAISEALNLPDVARRLKDLSLVPVGGSPEETAAFMKRESDSWRQFISSSGLKAD